MYIYIYMYVIKGVLISRTPGWTLGHAAAEVRLRVPEGAAPIPAYHSLVFEHDKYNCIYIYMYLHKSSIG